jgi:hypothetical protein
LEKEKLLNYYGKCCSSFNKQISPYQIFALEVVVASDISSNNNYQTEKELSIFDSLTPYKVG